MLVLVAAGGGSLGFRVCTMSKGLLPCLAVTLRCRPIDTVVVAYYNVIRILHMCMCSMIFPAV